MKYTPSAGRFARPSSSLQPFGAPRVAPLRNPVFVRPEANPIDDYLEGGSKEINAASMLKAVGAGAAVYGLWQLWRGNYSLSNEGVDNRVRNSALLLTALGGGTFLFIDSFLGDD